MRDDDDGIDIMKTFQEPQSRDDHRFPERRGSRAVSSFELVCLYVFVCRLVGRDLSIRCCVYRFDTR